MTIFLKVLLVYCMSISISYNLIVINFAILFIASFDVKISFVASQVAGDGATKCELNLSIISSWELNIHLNNGDWYDVYKGTSKLAVSSSESLNILSLIRFISKHRSWWIFIFHLKSGLKNEKNITDDDENNIKHVII